MKNEKHTITITITLCLILAFTASLVALPNVTAQTLPENTTHIYVAPQPVTGVGQGMFIVYFTDHMAMPCDWDATLGAPGNRETWLGITIDITHPDNTTETINAGPTDPVGAGYIVYTPTEIGDYSVQVHFPATWKNRTTQITYGAGVYRRTPPGDYYFSAADSQIATFTVQAEPIPKWPNPPLPTDAWMRPIPGPSNTWSGLAGNWLEGAANVWPQGGSGGTTNNYGYGIAPESAHILWTRTFYPCGSIVDERFGSDVNYYGGYQAVRYSSGPILDGKMHVNSPTSMHYSSGGHEIWDLYTGEQLFVDPEGIKPSFGQIYWYDSPNQHGCCLYLWQTSGVTLPEIVQIPNAVPKDDIRRLPEALGPVQTYNLTETNVRMGTVWEMLDAYTGKHVCYIANVSAPRGSTNVYAKDGGILYYQTDNLGTSANPNYYLQVWNSSHGTMLATEAGTGAWQWRPAGQFFGGSAEAQPYTSGYADNYVHDGRLFFTLNVSIPNVSGLSIRAVREGEYIIFGSTGTNNEDGIVQGRLLCLSLEEGQEGNTLWETKFTPPFDPVDWYQGIGFVGVFPDQGVFVFNSETELKNPIVYDMQTGQLLWEGDPTTEPQLGYYGFQTTVYEDMIITGGSHSGIITAYEAKTGEVRWQYTAPGEGTDSPYGNDLVRGFMVADGKLYTSISEHSESSPLWRSPGLKCFNITTGEEIWKILFWGRDLAIADGILTGWNYYDGQVYAFGKGPSATTVTASPDVSMHGSSVLIKGTVTDQTATGRRNVNNQMQFTLEGTPAISDEDMQKWMEYKFMGQGFPTDAEGVEVVISVMDPNSNYYEIGRTTSDAEGFYSLTFEPLVPGKYTVFAGFEGTKSYYGSQAVTAINVEEAPAATPMPTPPPASVADMYFLPVSAGVIIAIVVVGLLLFLMLRKR